MNRDLKAAAQAYEDAVKLADAQRPAAATAVFRLAESYRKLGRTNEAVALYRRVVSDFADQTLLVGFSRTNLARLSGVGPAAVSAPEAEAGAGVGSAAEARRLAGQLAGIDRLQRDPEQQAQAVLAFFPDEGLKRMLLHLPKLREQEQFARTNRTVDRRMVLEAIAPEGTGGALVELALRPGEPAPYLEEQIATQLGRIADRVAFILGTQRARLAVLEGVDGAGDAAGGASAPALGPAEVESLREELTLVEQELVIARRKLENGKAEESEVRRVQRELLRLQRRLPENLDPARQVTLLEQEIQLVEDNLREIRKRIEVGAAPPLDEITARRELLAVQRELAAAKRQPNPGPPGSAPGSGEGSSPSASTAPPATNAEADEIRRLEAIIRDSPDLVNARNAASNGRTPLHDAAVNGYLAVAEFLLSNQADANARDNGGNTPLHLAAEAGHKRLCELLLAKGAAVNATDDRGDTPLHQAVVNGYPGVTETLLAAGAQVNAKGYVPPLTRQPKPGTENWLFMETTPLHSAADHGFPLLVDLLIEHGAEVNVKDRGGRTPLLRALLRDQTGTVERLLDRGADLEVVDARGNTALSLAIGRQNLTLAQLLLDRGANLEARVRPQRSESAEAAGDWTVLFDPVGRGDVEFTRLLLDRGADPNAKASSGITPVHWAVLQNAPDTLKLLLERKAEVNARDAGGQTPLHYAASQQAPGLVRRLLEAKADPDAKDASGRTPWALANETPDPTGGYPHRNIPDLGAATATGSDEIIALLREHGATPPPAAEAEPKPEPEPKPAKQF